MPDTDKWVKIIEAVKNPLGFFTLMALILNGIILGAATQSSGVPMEAAIGLFGLLIVCVFILVLKNPGVLGGSRIITVSLDFPKPPFDVDPDSEKSFIEVQDNEGHVKYRAKAGITLGRGGWAVKMSRDIESTDNVRITIIETDGTQWKVHPFYPYSIKRDVVNVQGGN